jgi:hypothetical protein
LGLLLCGEFAEGFFNRGHIFPVESYAIRVLPQTPWQRWATANTDCEGLCIPRCPKARHLGHPVLVVLITYPGIWATRLRG